MWRKEQKREISIAMQDVLNSPPSARTTIGMKLVDCSTEEIVRTLMKINREAWNYQKAVMMRKELARRNPEYAKLRHHDIPIEMVFAWEIECRPFRELSRRKKERINHEKFKDHLERVATGMEAGAVS